MAPGGWVPPAGGVSYGVVDYQFVGDGSGPQTIAVPIPGGIVPKAVICCSIFDRTVNTSATTNVPIVTKSFATSPGAYGAAGSANLTLCWIDAGVIYISAFTTWTAAELYTANIGFIY